MWYSIGMVHSCPIWWVFPAVGSLSARFQGFYLTRYQFSTSLRCPRTCTGTESWGGRMLQLMKSQKKGVQPVVRQSRKALKHLGTWAGIFCFKLRSCCYGPTPNDWPKFPIQCLVGGLDLFFSIYWEESSQVTNIFQRGRSNHHPAMLCFCEEWPIFPSRCWDMKMTPSCSWCGVESAALTSRRRAQAASWQVIDRWNLCVLKGGTSHLPQPVLDPYKLDSILGFSWHYFRVYEGPQEINQFRSFFLMFSHF